MKNRTTMLALIKEHGITQLLNPSSDYIQHMYNREGVYITWKEHIDMDDPCAFLIGGYKLDHLLEYKDSIHSIMSITKSLVKGDNQPGPQNSEDQTFDRIELAPFKEKTIPALPRDYIALENFLDIFRHDIKIDFTITESTPKHIWKEIIDALNRGYPIYMETNENDKQQVKRVQHLSEFTCARGRFFVLYKLDGDQPADKDLEQIKEICEVMLDQTGSWSEGVIEFNNEKDIILEIDWAPHQYDIDFGMATFHNLINGLENNQTIYASFRDMTPDIVYTNDVYVMRDNFLPYVEHVYVVEEKSQEELDQDFNAKLQGELYHQIMLENKWPKTLNYDAVRKLFNVKEVHDSDTLSIDDLRDLVMSNYVYGLRDTHNLELISVKERHEIPAIALTHYKSFYVVEKVGLIPSPDVTPKREMGSPKFIAKWQKHIKGTVYPAGKSCHRWTTVKDTLDDMGAVVMYERNNPQIPIVYTAGEFRDTYVDLDEICMVHVMDDEFLGLRAIEDESSLSRLLEANLGDEVIPRAWMHGDYFDFFEVLGNPREAKVDEMEKLDRAVQHSPLYDLDLHEVYDIKAARKAMRVPGGWVYTIHGIGAVFVPWHNEFQ